MVGICEFRVISKASGLPEEGVPNQNKFSSGRLRNLKH